MLLLFLLLCSYPINQKQRKVVLGFKIDLDVWHLKGSFISEMGW